MLSLIEADSTDVYTNQATEDLLLRGLKRGERILYLWQNSKSVICGRNQELRDECNIPLLLSEGGKLARRISGGGAVYHDLGNLNFSFFACDCDYDVSRQLEVIRRALAAFDVAVEKSGRNDMTVGGRKFSGNAFARHKEQCLHHGTLMVALDIASAMRYLTPSAEKLARHAVSSVASRIVNLSEVSSAINADSLKSALTKAFGEEYGEDVARRELTAEELSERPQLAARFSEYSWLYRELGMKGNDEL